MGTFHTYNPESDLKFLGKKGRTILQKFANWLHGYTGKWIVHLLSQVPFSLPSYLLSNRREKDIDWYFFGGTTEAHHLISLQLDRAGYQYSSPKWDKYKQDK